jgi:hypothetical protein
MRPDAAQEQRVTIGWRLRGDVRADRSAGARAIVDDYRLTPYLRQLRTENARGVVDAAAGCEPHQQADRLRRIFLRVCDAGRGQRNHEYSNQVQIRGFHARLLR